MFEKYIQKIIYKGLYFLNDIGIYYPLRPMFSEGITDYNSGLVGVEIGVKAGRNALSVLKNCNIKRLFLVDPYAQFTDVNGFWSQDKMDEFYHIAYDRLKKFNAKIKFIRKKSEDAVGSIPNDLDFVYIDGNHEYEFVKKDVELYYPKVKVGGVIGGHDWDKIDVAKAAIEFADKSQLELHTKIPDWWIKKV